MFENWYDDDDDIRQQVADTDSLATDEYSLRHLTFDSFDQQKIMAYLNSKYNIIKVFYREMQRRSAKYPRLDFQTISSYIEEINETSYHMIGANKRLKL